MDKTDRELLQAAAKAAGYSVARLSDDDDSALCLVGVQQAWNPLTDDGEAFRLSVQLQLDVVRFLSLVRVDYQVGREYFETIEVNGVDPYAATRRAIVRAAAEIGEKQ
jgi:hypothetical protein